MRVIYHNVRRNSDDISLRSYNNSSLLALCWSSTGSLRIEAQGLAGMSISVSHLGLLQLVLINLSNNNLTQMILYSRIFIVIIILIVFAWYPSKNTRISMYLILYIICRSTNWNYLRMAVTFSAHSICSWKYYCIVIVLLALFS